MKVCIWPLCKWGLFLIVFAIKRLILSYFGIEEISIGGAPFGINLRSDIGLWGALSLGIVWCSDVLELVSHFRKFILMHLGAVEIICVFQFHLFQFLVILKDFLVFENLFILGLKQQANFAFVAVLFNACDLGLAHSFFDFRFSFAILLQLLNNAGYPVRKSYFEMLWNSLSRGAKHWNFCSFGICPITSKGRIRLPIFWHITDFTKHEFRCWE